MTDRPSPLETRSDDLDPSSSEFFEAKYRGGADPWDFARSPQEQARYRDLVVHLGEQRVERAFEPGCSVGVLTEMLAPRCRTLLASDTSASAVGTARRRCSRFDHVTITVGTLPALPPGTFDLIVFSEIGYYFDEPQLIDLVEALVDRLTPGGRLAGTHWTGSSPDHALRGDTVHDVIDRCRRLEIGSSRRRDRYLLGTWTRPAP